MQAKALCGRNSRLDTCGGVLSLVCAVHCLLVPVALPFLAAVVGNIWFEAGMMAGALTLGGLALSHGFKWHGFRWPMWAFGAGMLSLFLGNWVLTGGVPLCCASRGGHIHEASVSSFALVGIGGAMILAAHVTNFVLERRARRGI